jgi:hypothetical protein
MVLAVKKNLGSKKFLLFILAIFILQSVWYAASIKYRIPPDERYHYQVTNYYAERPVLSGPVIKDQSKATFHLGDIERTPSYLYHYLMSFPLKAVKSITKSENKQVIILRLINLLIVLGGLLILYKMFVHIKLTNLQINIIFLLLTMTGMFVWMSVAINYDSLAQVLFWASLYVLILMLSKPKAIYIIGFGVLAMATVITKITFAPILFISALASVVILIKSKKLKAKQLKNEFNISNRKLIVCIGAFLLVGVLFAERIGGNLINYSAITPACHSLHTKEECLNSGGYARSVGQSQIVQEMKNNGEDLDVIPGEFTSNWIQLMYDRIYFYLGHKQMQPTTAARTVGLLTVVFVIVLLAMKKKKLLMYDSQALLLVVTTSYILVLFYFNLSSYINSWAKFGYQGRYLLPVIPFIYMFSVLMFFNVYRGASRNAKKALLSTAVVLGLLNLYHHAPVLVFMRGTDSTWYTSSTISFNEKISNILDKLYLIDKKSVEYLESPD